MKPRSPHRHAYKADDAEMRAGWLMAAAILPKHGGLPKDLAEATRLPSSLALRVWLIREAGSLRAIELWRDRLIQVGALERAIRWAAYDEDGQLAEIAAASGEVRALLKRQKKTPPVGG